MSKSHNIYVKLVDANNREHIVTCSDQEDVVSVIVDSYNNNDETMWDVLNTVEITGLSVEAVVEIYGQCMYLSDGDLTVRIVNPDDVDYKDADAVELFERR